jgi:hypothetical protein
MKADALRTLEEEIRLETDMMARYELDLLKTVRPLFLPHLADCND